MLAMSDVDINQFLPVFSNAGINVAFLVPTPTGYGKSIMDATAPVRALLKEEGIHDYGSQGQGQENKVYIPAYFVNAAGLVDSVASLYRPKTKCGDPRIWIRNLREYCKPCNLLALFVYEQHIYVLNLSEIEIQNSIYHGGFVADLLAQIRLDQESVARELLAKIQAIHDQGYLPSITPGDPGVGDTLEHALGISRNNSKKPDYKGIELKSTRLTRHGVKRNATRVNLFSKVPDEGLTYREIVERYGKWQVARGKTEPRLQLYETFSTKHVNSYGLGLYLNNNKDRLEIQTMDCQPYTYVSSWQMPNLRKALLTKHPETFWVGAISVDYDGKEYFRYDEVHYTKKPNPSLLGPMLDSGKVTVDLAAHFESDGKWRDHGALFKINQEDISLLLGNSMNYDLRRPELDYEFDGAKFANSND